MQPTTKPNLILNRGTTSYIYLLYHCCNKNYSHFTELFSMGLFIQCTKHTGEKEEHAPESSWEQNKEHIQQIAEAGPGDRVMLRQPQARQATQRTKGVTLPQVTERHCFSATHHCSPMVLPKKYQTGLNYGLVLHSVLVLLPQILLSQTPKVKTYFHDIFTSSCLSLQLSHTFSKILDQHSNTTSPTDETFQYKSQLKAECL